jgi:hypothetical protein
MGLLNKDRLTNVGVPDLVAQTVEDQVTALGNASPPSAGGSSMNTTGNFFTFFGSAGNGADTTEDTLKSFTLPANALNQVGRGVYIYAWGTFAANTNTKAAKMYFGATSISTGAAASNNVGWALEMVVGKSAANAQAINGQSVVGTSHGGTVSSTGSETDTAAITIKVTGQDSTSANANAIVLTGLYAQFMN